MSREKADKRVYPWYFPNYYSHFSTRYPKHKQYVISFSGDADAPMVSYPRNSIKPLAEQGVQQENLYDILKTNDLTIEIPASHLNSELLKALLVDILPLSPCLETLTIKILEPSPEEIKPSCYNDMVKAFERYSTSIRSIDIVNSNDQSLLSESSVLIDEEDEVKDLSAVTTTDIEASGDASTTLAALRARNAHLAKEHDEKTNALFFIAFCSGLAALIVGIVWACLVPLFLPYTDYEGVRQAADVGTKGILGFGITLGLLALTCAVLVVAFLIRNKRQQGIGEQRKPIADLSPKLPTGIRIYLVQHAMRKAVSQACRPEGKKKETGQKARYQLNYWHPYKGEVCEADLTWKQVQERVAKVKVPTRLSSREDVMPACRVYYNMPTVTEEVATDIVGDVDLEDGTTPKNPKKLWFEQRQNFINQVIANQWLTGNGSKHECNAEGIAALFSKGDGASYKNKTAEVRRQYVKYRTDAGKATPG